MYKAFSLVILLLFLFANVNCLNLIHFELMSHIMTSSPNCTAVLYRLNTSDVNAMYSLSVIPLMVVDKPTIYLQESLSVRKAGCVLLFTQELSNSLLSLLSSARQKTVYVMPPRSDRAVSNLQQEVWHYVIAVQETLSGCLLLTESNLNVEPGLGKMLWVGRTRSFAKPEVDFTDIKKVDSTVLRGRTINVSATLSFPNAFLQQHVYTGIDIDMIDMIAQKMAFRFVIQEERFWIFKDSKTDKWTGVIGNVVDGHSQFGLGINFISGYDSPGYPAVLSPLIYSRDQNYLAPKPKLLKPYTNFIRPFTAAVWATFFASLIVCAIIAFIFASCNGDESMTWWKIFFDLYGSMWQQNLRRPLPNSGIYYLLFGFWFIAMCFKGCAYNCDLRAFIVKKVYEEPIETDEDIVRLNIDTYIAIGAGEYEFFLNSPSPAKREIARRALLRNTLYTYHEGIGASEERMIREGGVRIAIRSKNAFVLANFERHYGYQPLRPTAYNTLNSPVGIAMPQYEPWTDDANEIILHIIEAGLMDALTSKYSPVQKDEEGDKVGRRRNAEEVKLQPYQLEHIAGPLLALATGLILSLIVAFFESVTRPINVSAHLIWKVES